MKLLLFWSYLACVCSEMGKGFVDHSLFVDALYTFQQKKSELALAAVGEGPERETRHGCNEHCTTGTDP